MLCSQAASVHSTPGPGVDGGLMPVSEDRMPSTDTSAFCRAAGADPDLIPRWVEEGRRRAAQARKRPFGVV